MLDDLKHRLRSLFRRRAVERELQDELGHHVDLETDALIAAGLSPEAARRRALCAPTLTRR
jgi:hypothetical protein